MAHRITAADRRDRLGRRQGPYPDAARLRPGQVATDLVALHATDPATVYLSAAARARDLAAADVAAALRDRSLVRMLGMRRTMFVVPSDLAAVVQRSSTDPVAARLRRALVKDLAAVVPSPGPWLADVEGSVRARLLESGGSPATALSAAEPRLRTRLTYAEGKPYGGPATITSRVLNLMGADGLIARGPSRGSWTGAQYEWQPIENWFPDGIPAIDPAVARADLVRTWLSRFGPATTADVAWWTGWNGRDTGSALAAAGVVEVDLAGTPGVALPSDLEPVAPPDPWVALLPALDPTPMGWIGRDWYFPPEFKPLLFDRTGNIGPTVWCDGRVVGGWAQRSSGEVVTRLLTDVGGAAAAAVAAEAARLQEWIGPARVVPKFRTALERELVS